jgi:hypothetical protein
MKKSLLVLPCKKTDKYYTQGLDERVLPIKNKYPSSRGVPKTFDHTKFQELIEDGEENSDIFYSLHAENQLTRSRAYRAKKGKGLLIVGFVNGSYEIPPKKTIEAITTIVKVLVAQEMNWLDQTGVAALRKEHGTVAPPLIYLLFMMEIVPFLDEYKGNMGQVRAAKLLRGIDLRKLYTIASGLFDDVKAALGWTKIQASYATVSKLFGLLRKYRSFKGTKGRKRLAKKMKMDPLKLSYLVKALFPEEYDEKFGWDNAKVKDDDFMLTFSRKMNRSMTMYRGVEGQKRMAAELGVGESYLFNLARKIYPTAYEKLGWRYSEKKPGNNNPEKAVNERLAKEKGKYFGNLGQLKLAEELGINFLQRVYEAAKKDFDPKKDLGWASVNATCEAITKFRILVNGQEATYYGNHKQLEVAKQLGFINLEALYGIASAFGNVQQLGWKKLNGPYRKVAKLIRLLNGCNGEYKGDKGLARLSEELQINPQKMRRMAVTLFPEYFN